MTADLAAELGVRPSLIGDAIQAVRDRISWEYGPSPGPGRGPRLFGPEAVDEIRRWVESWKQDRASKARTADQAAKFWLRIDELVAEAEKLGRFLDGAERARQEVMKLCKILRDQPLPVGTSIHALGQGLEAAKPISVLLTPMRDGWMAASVDATLTAHGKSPEAAVDALRLVLESSYLRLKEEAHQESDLWRVLRQLIRSPSEPESNQEKP